MTTATVPFTEQAHELGEQHGKAAASWIDVPDADVAKKILRGIWDGDPAVMDAYVLPDLSGEMADGMTPTKLAEEVGFEPDDDEDESLDDISEQWEIGVSDGFWHALEQTCLAQMID